MKTPTCIRCGKPFPQRQYFSITCSEVCRREYARALNAQRQAQLKPAPRHAFCPDWDELAAA